MIYSHVLDLVGGTPLIDLPGLSDPAGARLVAKVEYFNPGGSIKDRIAVAMIEAAEESGALRPGGTIVEPTSGNTGVGLAIAANQRGYSCVFVCPDKVSQDKIAVLRAFGARVEVCPTSVAPEDPRSYYSVSDRLARELPDAWKPDQYSNAANPAAHYRTTGPELWEGTEGRITHLVAGIGTGGTISGAGRYLKEVSGGRVKVIGADPVGSVYSGGAGRPYLVEGVGEDFWPDAYDRDVADEIVAVTDREAFTTTRRLAVEHGLLVGGSSGMAAAAAARVASKARPDDLVVVILPDGGRGYLSKVFDDEWMRAFGFLRAQDGVTVREVLAAREQRLPTLIHIHPNESIRDAINLFHEFDVSQVPVLTAEPPVVDLRGGRLGLGAAPARPALPRRGGPRRSHPRAHRPATSDVRRRGADPRRDRTSGRPRRAAGRLRRRALRHHHPPGRAGLPVGEGLRWLSAGRAVHDATRVVHAGQEPDPATGAVVPPLHLASTFAQDAVGVPRAGYEYARSANPTRAGFEQSLAALESPHDAAVGLAFASGLAASDTLLRTVLRPGDHVIWATTCTAGHTVCWPPRTGAGASRWTRSTSPGRTIWQRLCALDAPDWSGWRRPRTPC